jgi:hypothetical protein
MTKVGAFFRNAFQKIEESFKPASQEEVKQPAST